MASIVEICNSALLSLGANTISALTEISTEAAACNAKWDLSRRALLRIHPWNFAIKRQELARTVAGPEYRFKYKYALPADCIRVLTVYQTGEYKVEGRSILSDRESCKVKYVHDNTDPATWDALFSELMSAKMAVELAYTLPRARTMIDAMYSLYTEKLRDAKFVDSSEDIEDEIGPFDHSLIAVRY